MSKRQSSSCGCSPDLEGLLDARFFKALGDSNRLALLCRLCVGGRPQAVGEMSCCCPVDLSGISRHLGVLRDAGIVESARQGKEVHYRVRCDRLAAGFRQIADALDACCPDGGGEWQAISTDQPNETKPMEKQS